VELADGEKAHQVTLTSWLQPAPDEEDRDREFSHQRDHALHSIKQVIARTVNAIDVDDGVAGCDELDANGKGVVVVLAGDRGEHARDVLERLCVHKKRR
jgi:hypothetical protein